MYCKVVFDVPLDRDFDYAVPDELAARAMPGVRVTASFGRMLTTGLIVSTSNTTTLPTHLIKKIACILDDKPLFGSDLFPLAQYIKQTWGGPIGQILFALVPPQAYFKLQENQTTSETTAAQLSPLTPEQKTAFSHLKEQLQKGFHRFLLTGADGVAHTQIAAHLAREVLQNYGQVLLTVPDVIAAQRLAQHLQIQLGKENVFCWHSRMLLSEKKIIFSRICGGLPCVVVSVRAGGLLPFKNLRLVVILEEENDNYKQEENKPYFHLRDLLTFRCHQHEALLIHASDTPSLEMLHAVKQGNAELLSLAQSAAQIPLQITTKKGEKSKLFSDRLLAALTQNLANKHASLLILNRRGYANTYYCFNCGAYAKCKECGNILSREKSEKDGDFLLCKKCGHKETLEQTCPKCQNKIFKSRGGGTQKIVSELAKLLPNARVLRLDSDTLKNKDGQGHRVRQALDKNQADIVVGTRQALEAAFSPRVTLAALMDGDLELDGPDFRASEKLGQLLFKLKNKLVQRPNAALFVQASSPDIYPFKNLQESYEKSAQNELLARESFAYPPYVKMVKVVVRAKDPILLEAEIAQIMSTAAAYATDILGPVKTGKATDKLLKQYILFKTSIEKYPALVQALDHLTSGKKTDFKLIADPYDFY